MKDRWGMYTGLIVFIDACVKQTAGIKALCFDMLES